MDLGINNNIINNIMVLNEMTNNEQNVESAARKAANGRDDTELRNACVKFEEIFLQMMYKNMKNTVPKSGLVSKGLANNVFESMLDEKLMEEASQAGGIGLADVLYRQLAKNQGNSGQR